MKETHCTVADLVPNAQYELWVTATNTTGISPASEKALYMTGKPPPPPSPCGVRLSGFMDAVRCLKLRTGLCVVPSPPVIKGRGCTSCPEAAFICWDSGNTNPVDSYTVNLSELSAASASSDVTE